MNQLKKLAGVIWRLLGPLTIYYLIKTAAGEIEKSPSLIPGCSGVFLWWLLFR